MTYHDYEDLDTPSISEMEEMEREDWKNRHRPIVGILFGMLFSAPFWLFGAYIYILRYYR